MSDEPTIGHNSGRTVNDNIKSLVERIERLNEDKKAVTGDTKEVYAEAKAFGLDTKILRKVVRERAREKAEREQEKEMVDLYFAALGMDWMA